MQLKDIKTVYGGLKEGDLAAKQAKLRHNSNGINPFLSAVWSC